MEELRITAAPIFGHVGDGNFHLLVMFDSGMPEQVAAVQALEHRLVERAIAMEVGPRAETWPWHELITWLTGALRDGGYVHGGARDWDDEDWVLGG